MDVCRWTLMIRNNTYECIGKLALPLWCTMPTILLIKILRYSCVSMIKLYTFTNIRVHGLIVCMYDYMWQCVYVCVWSSGVVNLWVWYVHVYYMICICKYMIYPLIAHSSSHTYHIRSLHIHCTFIISHNIYTHYTFIIIHNPHTQKQTWPDRKYF